MPQFQEITANAITFTPEQISSVSASGQDLTGPLGSRHKVFFDRNAGENGSKAYRRVVRVQLNFMTSGAEPKPYQVTCSNTLVFPRDSSAADRQKAIATLTGVLANAGVKASLENPEWFY